MLTDNTKRWVLFSVMFVSGSIYGASGHRLASALLYLFAVYQMVPYMWGRRPR